MADVTAALFFAEMRFDPKDPRNPDSDRFVLSKGHAAPILYAAWAEAGAFDRSELLIRLLDDRTDGALHLVAGQDATTAWDLIGMASAARS